MPAHHLASFELYSSASAALEHAVAASREQDSSHSAAATALHSSMHRFLLAAVAAAATPSPRQRHEIGKLPALGYNTWNDVRCDGVDAG